MSTLPLLFVASPDDPVAWRDGAPIPAARFLGEVAALSARLPDTDIVNLCEDRYHFLVAFAATLCRGHCNLLPASRAEQAVATLLSAYPGSRTIADAEVADAARTAGTVRVPVEIPAARLAAVLSTSGSTGAPTVHGKSWGEFIGGARLLRERLPFSSAQPHLLATVPAQHMYGLETTVMLALGAGVRIDTGRPFFPADVHARLSTLPAPRALVSTPLHLKACLDAALIWPKVDFVLSATAPMPTELARRIETAFDAPLLEIYGSTETGALATRRTAESLHWQPLPGVSVRPQAQGAVVSAAHFQVTIVLKDQIESEPDGRFHLLGRDADLIKIAGKRASLAELNLKLTAVPGVVDGAFVLPRGDSARLAALVVAPHLSARAILDQLRAAMDPVFLPRPLLKVDALPRNETGKLPRQSVLDLLRELETGSCPTA